MTKGAEYIETVEETAKVEETPVVESESPKVVVTLKEEAETLKPEETPTAETPKEETPKEETPKEETPKEETPKEETPKEETPKEETLKEETPMENMSSEDNSCVHQKARQPLYQGAPEGIVRFQVKDEEVDWKVELPTYSPVAYTEQKIISDKPVWADPDVL